MAWLLVTPLVLALALALYLRIRSARRMEGIRLPKCVPALPIIGSLLAMRGTPNPHILFKDMQKKYGELFAFMMGSHYTVIVNKNKHAREVLHKKGKIFCGRPTTVTTDILTREGKGIAFSDYGPAWRFHRKLVHNSLNMFGEGSASLERIISREANAMCETLTEYQHISIDMAPELTRAITNVVCTLCFNSSYKRGDPEFESMLKYSQGIVDTVAKDSLVDIFPWLQLFPNKDLQILKKSVAERDKLLNKKYNERKTDFNADEEKDLMDSFLRAKRNLENDDMRVKEVGLTDDHVLMTLADIFGAGVETTSTVMKWMIAYLIHYPEVQKKIQEEMDNNIGLDRQPSLSDRGRLPYLEATIREVLRIRPVTPLLVPHVAIKDSSIGEYTIPKGARVVINLWSIHHDDNDWLDPDKFDPGRFLDEEGQLILAPSPSFLPFGVGIRVCLGEALAKMELFLFMGWLLQRFSLAIPEGHSLPDLQGKFGVVLQPDKFKVDAKLRDIWLKNQQDSS
ncbi:steroid 17-alpha-hydroxylase/17,20 lyase [Erpetoichthys calabaricus]|uniref:Cytochrome P450, family 17, subfamily A, polypeptide 1 n=1 Tax=Erpetoichthys calabaricus TaxID=27687 RepID=A0A8C4S485_ERPCA|nr:steroid 17-alpha-hydroxylase/17,20 lyase [Erpetoichthys calabaricus]